MDIDVDHVGANLKKMRQLAGLSQQDLANGTGIHKDSISGIERGERQPRPSTLRKLAQGLEVDVSDILTGNFDALLRPLAQAPALTSRELGLAQRFAEFEEQGRKIVAGEATPHTAPSLVMAMEELLHEAQRAGAISEGEFEDYMVRAFEITHEVQGVLERQRRQLTREIAAIRERERFFATHSGAEDPQQAEAS